MQYRDKDSYLWSVLPVTGITTIVPTSPKVTKFPNSLLPKTRCYGIPYTNNSKLNVLNFTSSSLNGPITSNGPVLYFFSALAIAHFKWTAIGAPSTFKIGFYTSNWLNTSSNQDKYYLLPTDRGLSLFGNVVYHKPQCDTNQGEFYTTGFTVFSVIIEGSFALELEVTYCNPKCLPALDLKLYLPQPYGEYDDEIVMTQEYFDKEKSLVLYKPTPAYLIETANRIAYLESTAVNLIFTDIPIPVLNKLGVTSTLIDSVTFKGLTMQGNNTGPYTLGYSEDVKNAGRVSGIFRNDTMAIKSITKPGINIVPVVTVIFQRSIDASVNSPGDYLIHGNAGVYGNLAGIFGSMEEYSIRNQLCSFSMPEYTITLPKNGRHHATSSWEFSNALAPNVESISLRIFGVDITNVKGFNLLEGILIIDAKFYFDLFKIDFYQITI